jgi:hypothetical protein
MYIYIYQYIYIKDYRTPDGINANWGRKFRMDLKAEVRLGPGQTERGELSAINTLQRQGHVRFNDPPQSIFG